MSKCVACSRVVTPFKLHCRLDHPSLFVEEAISSFKYESCQYAKLYRVHLSPIVNKQAFAPFELVHFDVWGPCPTMSPIGFKYFAPYMDDYSRVT